MKKSRNFNVKTIIFDCTSLLVKMIPSYTEFPTSAPGRAMMTDFKREYYKWRLLHSSISESNN